MVITAPPAQSGGCYEFPPSKLIDVIEVRGLSRNTKKSYIGFVSRLSRHYHRPPDLICDAEPRAYLLHLLRERKNEVGSPIEAIETALPRMKKPILQPRVYSPEQVAKLLQVDGLNLKHRTLLITRRMPPVCAGAR